MRTTLITLLLAATLPGFSAEAPHPLDVQFGKIDTHNASTAEVRENLELALEAWDKELNAHYAALMKLLPKASADSLRASQRKWIELRDAEFVFIESFRDNLEGSMFNAFIAAHQKNFVRERALWLKKFHDLWKEFKTP